MSVNQYFNSVIGLLGVTMFFEWQASFPGGVIDQMRVEAWAGIGWTIVNRFNLSGGARRDFYGARAPVYFSETIFDASEVWTGLNRNAYGSPGAVEDVKLRYGSTLYEILSGSPSDGRCAALAVALGTALRVIQTAFGIMIVPGAEPLPNPYPNALYFTTGGVVPGTDSVHRPVRIDVVGAVTFWGVERIPIRGARNDDNPRRRVVVGRGRGR
jgi:hypothetical protein